MFFLACYHICINYEHYYELRFIILRWIGYGYACLNEGNIKSSEQVYTIFFLIKNKIVRKIFT